jgi:hypothetical protein
MMILTQRMKTITIGETIRKAISDWYFENGKVEPIWYAPKNPDWWVDYLRELDENDT